MEDLTLRGIVMNDAKMKKKMMMLKTKKEVLLKGLRLKCPVLNYSGNTKDFVIRTL